MLVYAEPGSSLSVGWARYVLEQRYGQRVTAVRASSLGSLRLSDYDVIVFPDGWEYARHFDDGAVKRLKEWVTAGGTLIGMRGSAAFLARPETDLTTARAVKDVRKVRREEKPAAEGAEGEEGAKSGGAAKEKTEPAEDGETPPEFQTDQVPGAILRGKVVSVPPCGAFVDLGGGVQGLVHVSEMGWSRSTDAAQIVSPGAEVTVKVLRVDETTGKSEEVTFLPGFLRGLAFHGGAAIIGMSLPRERSFSGLELDDNLKKRDADPRCGIQIVDLRTGDVLQWIRLEGQVRELFDVAVIPEVRCPMAVSPQSREFASTVTRVDQFGSLNGA